MKKSNALLLLCSAAVFAGMLLAVLPRAGETQTEPVKASSTFVYSNANTPTSQGKARMQAGSGSSLSSAQGVAPYCVRAYEGKIGVFRDTDPAPYRILDVRLDALPQKDQALLQAGIPADSSEQLQSIVEDYTG